MAQTDGKLGLNYAAGSEVTSWNDVAENMRKIDSFATQIDGKMTDDAAALATFKGSVLDGADEIWATTQDGIPAGAHGVSRLITSVRTTITQKVAELTEKITANTTKADANAADIELLNSNLDCGKATTTTVQNGVQKVNITFNKTFTSPPILTFSYITSQISTDRFSIANITATGASLAVYTTTTNHSVTFYWQAQGMPDNL